ncbi:MAG: PQQ-binding-like beta-propeller repeat protein [Actinomycetota bacterium]|nr:PQQ-binding-like beta-propeller repeat protein [Actinomycetota bacterium]
MTRARAALTISIAALLLIGIAPIGDANGSSAGLRHGPRVASQLATPGSLWVKRYNGTGDGSDYAGAIGVSSDGSEVFVTGYSYGSTTADDHATVAYDASTGARLWVKRYNGPGNGYDDANALGVSPDGSKVFVTGESPGSSSNDDYATVAYDASSGAELWVKRYNGLGNSRDDATALGVSPDGSVVFVTGFSYGSANGYDYATVAYDALTGARLWAKGYDGPANGDDVASAAVVSPDSSQVFVTGYSVGSTGHADYATVSYDASTGAAMWAKRYDGTVSHFYADYATALDVSPDSSQVFVTGYSPGSTSGDDYATLAYKASTGAKLWVKRYNGPANGTDDAYDVGVSPGRSKVFVTGRSSGTATGFDYATVAYNASTGAKIWVKRYNGPGDGFDEAYALGTSPDGSQVSVTGRSDGSTTRLDYATVTYDAATGAKLWTRRYDGPGDFDEAHALGTSPDGSEVFVTGFSEGPSGGTTDYATVAYGT